MRPRSDRSRYFVADPGNTSPGCHSLDFGTSSKPPTTKRRRNSRGPNGAPWPWRCCGRSRRLRSTEVPCPRPSSPSCVSARALDACYSLWTTSSGSIDRPFRPRVRHPPPPRRAGRVRVHPPIERGGQAMVDLERALPPGRLQRITLGPLSLGALQAMLRARLGGSLPRPLLRRIHEASDGSPFFALEIARALERDSWDPGSALPVPRDLQALLRERIERLPATARPVLLIVAASSQPTPDLVAAATGLDREARCPCRCRTCRRDRNPGRTGPVHSPAACVDRLRGRLAAERRAVHRALADRATDPEERARHLALGFGGP